jgi:hypothetical protein
MRAASMTIAGVFVNVICPISSFLTIAALTGAVPSNVRILNVSADTNGMLASEATVELTTVMLDPESSQNS